MEGLCPKPKRSPRTPGALGRPVRRRRGRGLGLGVWKEGAAGGSLVVSGAACACVAGLGAELWGDGSALMDLTLDGLVFQGQWGAGAPLPSCV